jgi:serine/threonine protein kinase
MDGGDMFSYINHHGPIPEFEMMGYFRQILSALEYVHSFNICHRDLKPENILMKTNGVVKIADFGMAAIQQSPTHALKTSCGSPHYAAPELIGRIRYQLDKVDIWSLGCILYATLCRRLPFDDPEGNVPRLLAKAGTGIYHVPEILGKDARDLISKMLTVDPRKRISIRKIWQHPLLRKYDDLDDLNNGGRIINTRADDKSKPVPPEELDLQISRQLKSMWHTFSEKQIAMQLTNNQ